MSFSKSPTTSKQDELKPFSLQKRLSSFFESKTMSDVTFLVSNSDKDKVDKDRMIEFPGHKFLLCAASTVFEEMFKNPLANQDDRVVVTGVSPSAFRTMLKYIYCEEIEIEEDQLTQVLEVANKYNLPELFNATLDKVTNSLNEKNFFDLIRLTTQFDLEALKERFSQFITINTQWIINQPEFLELSREHLALILKQDSLSITESDLFNACLKWARAQCQIENPGPKKLRKALGKLLYFFRLTSFTSVKEFLDIANSGVFTDTEIVDCLYFIVSDSERQKSIIQKFVSLEKRIIYEPVLQSESLSDSHTEEDSLRSSSFRSQSSRTLRTESHRRSSYHSSQDESHPKRFRPCKSAYSAKYCYDYKHDVN